MAYQTYDKWVPSGSRSGASIWSQGRRIERRGGLSGKGSFNVWAEFDPPIRELVAKFSDLRKEIFDMRPAWDVIVPQLRRAIGAHVVSQGSAQNEQWPPLNPDYLNHKSSIGQKRRHAGRAMLVLTGKLLTKLTTKGVLRKNKRLLKYGVKAPGVRALHFGSPQQNIGKRTFMVITPKIRAFVNSAVNARIGDVCKKFCVSRGSTRAASILRRKAA